MHRVELTELRGNAYSVNYNGRTIVERSHSPELDAAVALDALGIVGSFATFTPGSTLSRMRVADISEAAECRREVLAQIANAFRKAA